ncbi:MAG: hypothetical protein HOP29_04435 [Phycisphaerales bacterium]|nr:hypothetical protein [Phycisphaerales bacterium]
MARNKWIGMVCIGVLGPAALVHAQPESATSFQLSPVQDAFTRFAEPTLSYGDAGAMHVAGGGAGNADGDQMGVADAWVQFAAAEAIEQFNVEFGAGGWMIESATLTLSEVGSPRSDLFGRGVGEYTIDWVANDDWAEGAGKPKAPGLAGSITLGFDTGRSIRDAAVDETVGTFSNAGADQTHTLELALTEGFVADVMSGGLITLNFVSADPRTGFTFYSSDRKQVDTRQPPTLTVTAVALGTDVDDDSTDSDDEDDAADEDETGDDIDDSADDVDGVDDGDIDDDDIDDGIIDEDDVDDVANDDVDDSTGDNGTGGTVDEGTSSGDDGVGSNGETNTAPIFNCGQGTAAAMILSTLGMSLVGIGRRTRFGFHRS